MSDRQKIHLKRLICSKAAVSKLTEKKIFFAGIFQEILPHFQKINFLEQ